MPAASWRDFPAPFLALTKHDHFRACTTNNALDRQQENIDVEISPSAFSIERGYSAG
jgi:hypothetical protein